MLVRRVNIARITIFSFYLTLIFILLFVPKLVKYFSPRDELSICTFADLMPIDLIEKFEKETGIKVNVKYCELDPEFWAQLALNNGKGLDLVTPTDFIASRLVKAGLLQKVDKSLLSNMVGFHEKFLRKDFDQDLDYCIPFSWNYYAIGYNKEFFQKYNQPEPTSLQAVFEPQAFFDNPEMLQKYKVALFEDNAQELIFLGALHLFKEIPTAFSVLDQKRIKDLFIQHKHNWLYAFVSANMSYYLNSVVPVVLCFASLLKNLLEDNFEKIGSFYPKEGSVVVPQSFCIPIGAKNLKAVHKFIDFFIENQLQLEVFDAGGYLPVKSELLKSLRTDRPEFFNFIPSAEEMENLVFINQVMSLEETEQLWMGIKSEV